MPRIEFIDKLLQRIDKLDRASVRKYIESLLEEQNFFWKTLDSLEEGVLVLDPERKLLFMNKAARAMLGVSESVRINERPIGDVVSDGELLRLIEAHAYADGRLFHREVEILEPRETALTVSLSPMSDSNGGYLGSVVLLSNITGMRQEEREAIRREKIESLVTLAAGIAHEIGNPLNSIGIQLNLLRREVETLSAPKRKKMGTLLAVIQSEVSRLDRIVRNFLQATRRRMTQFKREDLNQILEEATRGLEPEMKGARVRLVLRLNRKIPPFLMDREKMHQVFSNIIKNAIQSMPKGGVLTIQSDLKGKVCQVTFRDEGVGIPKELLPHVFEAYFTTKEEGAGLGLVIVHDGVKEHGGRVEVKSEVGQGTEVKLFLPLRSEKLPLPGKVAVQEARKPMGESS